MRRETENTQYNSNYFKTIIHEVRINPQRVKSALPEKSTQGTTSQNCSIQFM